MLFNSYEFILFYLPIVLVVFFVLARSNRFLAASWLTLSSIFFYAWWDYHFLTLLIASILFNFFLGKLIGRTENKRKKYIYLIFGISINLATLVYYKYALFFVENLNTLVGTTFNLGLIILPLGISFYTFTQIAFLVDTYKGYAREYNLVKYSLFVTFFPHLIAGPILHHKEMMSQFDNQNIYKFDSKNFSMGLTLFVCGLFKKMVLADNLAPFATSLFANANQGISLTFFESWVAALTYTFQLYFDFSAYSEMALGLALLFNIRLPINFLSPYKARNIIEFWRRWHMTLSRFLRDYLYIPLGGNRSGEKRRYTNLMITMVLGGLWHGAGWPFVIWGTLHGCYLLINHAWRKRNKSNKESRHATLKIYLSTIITFFSVVIAWVFFRAPNMATASIIIKGMIGLNGISLPQTLEPKLGSLLQYNVFFHGLLPSVPGISVLTVLFLLMSASFICFCLPNLILLTGFKDTDHTESSPSNQIEKEIFITIQHKILKYIAWRPTTMWSIIVGIFFTYCILNLSKVSEFLYFQF